MALTCTEGPEINLSSPGGSLENLRTTDQNGLGICHIEQLHKMLKAKLPGHPDLARVQLAMAEKKKRDEDKSDKKALRWMSADLKTGGTYIDAGSSCGAYNLIKGSRICLAESDRFEQLTNLKPNYQSEIMHRLSYYFDNNQKSPTEEILGLLRDAGPTLENNWQACSIDQVAFDKFKNTYSLFALNSSPKAAQTNSTDIMLSPQEVLSGVTFNDKIYDRFELIKEAPEDVKSAYYDLVITYRKTEACMLDQMRAAKEQLQCKPVTATESRVLELAKYGFALGEVIRVLKGDTDRDKFFEETFKCADNQKVGIPDINCQEDNLLPLAKAATDLLEYQTSVAASIDQQLAKGTPVGISTCTRWFKNPTVTSVTIGQGVYRCGDKSDSDYKTGEGSHAVTIIGSRCKGGAPEYLVQNSWGTGCSYHKDFECTKKGGFWAPASTIINNIRSISFME